MIFDTFEKVDLYFGEAALLREALDFAENFDLSLPDGRYEVDGDNLFANVMSYETQDAEDLKFEGHKTYIDIQLLLEGEEFMDVSLAKDLEVDVPYSEEVDVALFEAPKRFSSVLLEAGKFAVVFPDDLHRPGRMIEQSAPVRKMVVKVRI